MLIKYTGKYVNIYFYYENNIFITYFLKWRIFVVFLVQCFRTPHLTSLGLFLRPPLAFKYFDVADRLVGICSTLARSSAFCAPLVTLLQGIPLESRRFRGLLSLSDVSGCVFCSVKLGGGGFLDVSFFIISYSVWLLHNIHEASRSASAMQVWVFAVSIFDATSTSPWGSA